MNRPAIIAIAGGAVFVAVLLAVVFFATGGGASASKSQVASAPGGDLRATTQVDAVSAAEAGAWAEARAEDTASAYRVYLAAYPDGAFAQDARASVDRLAQAAPAATRSKARVAPDRAPAPAPVRYAETPVVVRDIAGECRAYVDRTLPQPSRVGRTVGGAAGGCAVGLLAGGDDGRNCAIGAIAGGATGAITAENRERRRRQEVDACIAHGGPPG